MKVTIEVSEDEADTLRNWDYERFLPHDADHIAMILSLRLREALPREIKVGDVVRLRRDLTRYFDVAGIRSGQAWLFWCGTDSVWGSEDLTDLTLADA